MYAQTDKIEQTENKKSFLNKKNDRITQKITIEDNRPESKTSQNLQLMIGRKSVSPDSFSTIQRIPKSLVIQRDDSDAEEDEYGHIEGMEEVETEETNFLQTADPLKINKYLGELGADAVQLARKGNAWSGPKDIGSDKNISYFRDTLGNINFNTPLYQPGGAPHPAGDKFIKGGYWVNLGTVQSTKNRTEHFLKANKIVNKKFNANFPNSGVSPTGWTWHHLSKKPEMILVNREAHRRFGHNGGVYIWT